MKIRFLRFIRVLLLPNSSTTQLARTTTHYFFASWRLGVSQFFSSVFPFYHTAQIVVIRIIRLIRGLSFSLSTSTTIRHRSCRLGESAYGNAFTLSFRSVKIRFYPFHPCSISTKQLDTNMILPLVLTHTV